jgi:hypothetical protein
MAELIGKLAPISGADVDDDPGCIAWLSVQPNAWRSCTMIIDVKFLRLLIGKKRYTG